MIKHLWLQDLRAKAATGGGTESNDCRVAVLQVPWLAQGRHPASVDEARVLVGRELSCLCES